MNHATRSVLLAGLLSTSAAAQIIYAEDFQTHGTIASLEAEGWVFRNQTDIPNRLGWDIDYSGGPVGPLSLEASTWAGDGNLATWAIMPAISGQAAGMPMHFHISGHNFNPPRHDWMELRYSPTGGTNTGAAAGDVGDFSQVLWSGTPQSLGMWWTERTITLPGTGRLAWRYGQPSVNASGRITIDGIEIGTPSTLLLPGPGETVTWTAAMSPIVIDAPATIVETGTVILEPGVTVMMADHSTLTVAGNLIGGGDAENAVILAGSFTAGLTVAGTGIVELAFTEIDCDMRTQNGAAIVLTDSVIRPDAGGFWGGRTAFVELVRTRIEIDYFAPWGNIVLDDVVFTGDELSLSHYPVFRGLESQAGLVSFIAGYQDKFVDEVTVTGAPGPAVRVRSDTWGAADVLFGPANVFTGNAYPVDLDGPGLHPETTLDATGNTTNAVLLSSGGGGLRNNRMTWPKLDIDYLAVEQVFIQGGVNIAPGVTFRATPGAWFYFLATQSDFNVRGTPENPIRFLPHTPGVIWGSVVFDIGSNLLEHVEIEQADQALGAFGTVYASENIIRDCVLGFRPSSGFIYAKGNQFYNNQTAVREDSSPIFVGLDLTGTNRPNLFEGNDLAIDGVLGPNGEWAPINARNNWWGAPDGPSVGFPGSGDPVDSNAQVVPYRTSRPDLDADHPPVVRLVTRPYRYAPPGETLILEWSAQDDFGIESQRITYQDTTTAQFVTLADNLPGDQNSIELVLPPSVYRVRINATDTAGQTAFEQFELSVPNTAPSGSASFNNNLTEGFTGGMEEQICYNATGYTNSIQIFLELSGEERWVRGPAGPGGNGACSYSTFRFPYISTDRARFAIDGSGGNNTEWYFSENFEIRPDARIGDAPPTIEMTAPVHGASFTGGSTIPIRWNASDDEGLREFKIQYSTNGGHTWHTLRHRLPGHLRAFDWQLPASNGIDDLRVRVMAADLRFQASTDGDDHHLTLTPGAGCPVDMNGDGVLDFFDVADFLDAFSSEEPAADFNDDGLFDFFDVADYLDQFSAGCG